MNTPTISNTKIIAFVVFIVAAIMTSLFIYRLSHPAINTTLSNDAGSLFPTAKDIKELTLEQANGEPFTEKALPNHWTLLFFGFTHCASICPTTLDMLKRAYTELHPIYPNLQIILVSLDPERDNAAALLKYTKSFHRDFIGVTGNLQHLRKLQSQFGIYAAREEGTNNNYQLQHSSSIMLINPEGKWAGLFRYGLNPKQFVSAFRSAAASYQSR